VLQTMADQIAIALENARLLAESQTAVEAIRRASGELSREGWSQMLRMQFMPGVRSVESGVVQAEGAWPAEARRALQEGQVIYAGVEYNDDGANAQSVEDNAPLAIPVKVRGNVIGVVDTFKPAGSGGWTPEEIALAETLAEQLGIALESARLYQDTQRRAAQERLIGQVTTRMRETLDIDTILRTAASEIRQTFGLPEVSIQFVSQADGTTHGQGPE
jgi:GAF domain-containing protein